jgi:hypothetical protein
MKPLHLVTCLRVVSKHTHIPKISIAVARDAIQRLTTGTLTHEDQQLIEELEKRTGVTIAELAKLTDKWPQL